MYSKLLVFIDNMNAADIESIAETRGCHTLLTAIPAEVTEAPNLKKTSCIACTTSQAAPTEQSSQYRNCCRGGSLVLACIAEGTVMLA